MPVSKSSANRFTILYGSQTGQAKAIAEEIHESSDHHGLNSNLFCLSLTEKKFTLEKEALVVFVVSTTGEGDPPDTMGKFMRRLKKKTLPGTHLQNLHFALLALGDTNYTNFCNNGKELDKRLLQLGARQFYDTGYADDAVGLELVVEPWIDGLWPALRKHLGLFSVEESPPEAVNMPTIKSTDLLINGKCSSLELIPAEIAGGNTIQPDNKTSTLDTSLSRDVVVNWETKSSGEPDDKVVEHVPGLNSVLVTTGANNGEAGVCDASLGSRVDIKPNETATVESVNGQSSLTIGHDFSEQCSSSQNPPLTLGDQLKMPAPSLLSSALSIPQLPPPYLDITFHPDHNLDRAALPLHNGVNFPSAVSGVSMATVISAKQLTSDTAVKTALDIELDITDCGMSYEPGDSFGVVCPNFDPEVEELIAKLRLSEKADTPFTIQLRTSTSKKSASVPNYIPENSTIRHALLTCLEIRAIPSKALIRVLSEHTTDPQQKRRLQELCSKQGTNEYRRFVREPGLSLLDLLNAFPSCQLPFERLLELLPRLKARPYSVSSSPLENPTGLHFVFNIVEITGIEDIKKQRQGVCTGWLNDITKIHRLGSTGDSKVPIDCFTKMSLERKIKVPVFQRNSLNFKLPGDPETPIIMIGPGTGIAPFIGFLKHRELKQKNLGLNTPLSEAWLFFGCRHKERDYLYRQELETSLSSGVLSRLFVSFSRDTVDELGHSLPPKYVQDNLRLHSTEVAEQVFEKGAVVYICGDALNMARNVYDTFLEIVREYKSVDITEARKEMVKLRENKQYLEDIWT
ncbi:methionine synthase reductase-like [Montipora capricornis]|uniref:methionine synthase reductase-like n=1 Tax=Montipora capricornis TaxID=246305 RepID=UPI0035F152F7